MAHEMANEASTVSYGRAKFDLLIVRYPMRPEELGHPILSFGVVRAGALRDGPA